MLFLQSLVYPRTAGCRIVLDAGCQSAHIGDEKTELLLYEPTDNLLCPTPLAPDEEEGF